MQTPKPQKVVAAMKELSIEFGYRWPMPYNGEPDDFVQSVRERLIAFDWHGCVKFLRKVYGKLDEVPNDFGAAFHGAFAACCVALDVNTQKDSWKVRDPSVLRYWGVVNRKVKPFKPGTDTQRYEAAKIKRKIDYVLLQGFLYKLLQADHGVSLPKIDDKLKTVVLSLKRARREIFGEDAS